MSAEVLTPAQKLGLERIRRLSWLAGAPWIGFPLALVLGFVALALDRAATGGAIVVGALSLVVGFGSVVVGIVASIRYSLSRCPRCAQLFLQLPRSKWSLLWPTKACRSCGLSLKNPK